MFQDLIVKKETTKCGHFGEVIDRKHLLDPSCVYSESPRWFWRMIPQTEFGNAYVLRHISSFFTKKSLPIASRHASLQKLFRNEFSVNLIARQTFKDGVYCRESVTPRWMNLGMSVATHPGCDLQHPSSCRRPRQSMTCDVWKIPASRFELLSMLGSIGALSHNSKQGNKWKHDVHRIDPAHVDNPKFSV